MPVFFRKGPERVLFGSRKAYKRRFFCYFLRRAKSNQKARGANALRPRFKALHRRTFYRNCSFPCLKQLSGFEPVEKGDYSANAESGFVQNRSRGAGLLPQAVV